MPLSKVQSASLPGHHVTPLSLRKNFSWTFASNLISGACQWAMLAALAKLVSPVKVGEYAYALAIISPVFLFAGLCLSNVEATDSRRINTFGEYFGLRLIMLAFSVVVLAGIAIFLHPSHEFLLVIAMVTGIKIFDSLSDIMFGLQQQHERMDYSSISRSVQGVLQFSLLAIVVWQTRSIVWGTAVIAIGSGLLTIFYDTRMTARVAAGRTGSAPDVRTLLRPSWNLPRLWTLARLSLPLGFVAVFGMLNINIPRYFVQDHLGLRELGIFSAMWSMLHPVGLVSGSVTSSVIPRMARYYVESISQFKRTLSILLAMTCVSGVTGVLLAHFFGRLILSSLFRPDYAEHPVTFQWMMAAAGMMFISSALNAATGAARSYKLQPIVFLVAMLSNLVACYVLVPRYGVLGATWSYLIGCITLVIGFGILVAIALNSAKQRDTQIAQAGSVQI